MALHVIEASSEVAEDRSKAIIVVESDQSDHQKAFFELKEGPAARNVAISYAATRLGMASPRINGNVSAPFAVNREGVELTEVKGPNKSELPLDHPLRQPFRYRIQVPLCPPLM